MSLDKIVLFGAGNMGQEYAKVLDALGAKYEVVGRSEAGVARFREATGHSALPGGFEAWRRTRDPAGYAAIIAVSVEELAHTALEAMESGIRRILLEKPAGMNTEEICNVNEKANVTGTHIMVAYNRRFYASTLKAQEMIGSDGGVLSFIFEFTEWPHTITIHHPEVLNNWYLANSTHLVDLAFLLGGLPRALDSRVAGTCAWHPAATQFVGSGVTTANALFSYHANWDAPGRFSLEIMTARHRLIFRPVEKLHVTKHGSVSIDPVPLEDRLDKDFKPGLYRQTECFLRDTPHPNKVMIDQHERNWSQWYHKIVMPTGKQEARDE